jgi:hypothetical protein
VPKIMDAAAVCNGGHDSVRLNAEACSWCPEDVTQRRSSASRPSASERTRGSTRSATGTPGIAPTWCP